MEDMQFGKFCRVECVIECLVVVDHCQTIGFLIP